MDALTGQAVDSDPVNQNRWLVSKFVEQAVQKPREMIQPDHRLRPGMGLTAAFRSAHHGLSSRVRILARLPLFREFKSGHIPDYPIIPP